jgi:hypothetical protein
MMQDVNETTFETLQRDHIENNARPGGRFTLFRAQ